ncbi:MAG: hypothetical protein EON58_19060 [Alphaproteobacteria bacterium]|nr:MAG: hypothetical protein EON58_19060 [Alphaproteobacteria bacterium]
MDPAKAITIVLNRSAISNQRADSAILNFFREEDKRRLGGRYYEKHHSVRSMALLAPEKFRDGHPHYHGLIRLPPEYRFADGLEQYQASLSNSFDQVFAGSSIRLSDMTAPEGWIGYASKETDLLGGEGTLFTHLHISPKAFA